MGLDMYLNATRAFDPDSDEAEHILAAANVSLDELKEMATRDPHKEENSIHLGRWSFYEPSETARSTAVLEAAGILALEETNSPGGDLRYENDKIIVEITCMYWRKANAIHGWFVDNCQDGIDECQETPIEAEQLAYLRHTCQKALEAYLEGDVGSAAELLSPRAGFFFGSYDIDDWWAQELRYTINTIEKVVNYAAEIGGIAFTYQSSW